MKSSNLPILLAFGVALIASLQSLALAELVIPSAIKAFHQGDSLSGDGSALRVIDGSGMAKIDADDPTTWTINSTAWQDDWQGFATPSGNNTWTVLDLGAATPNLDKMHLWNVQENAPGNQSARGMNNFNVFFATSPTVSPPNTSGSVTSYDFSSGGWTQVSGSFALSQGSGNGDAGQSFDVSAAAGARYIGLQILSNHGAGDRVGFGEVAFTTAVPTGAPAVATLPATSITAGGARIRGDLTDLGTSTPTVRIYWGTSDGGASTGGWTNVANLGTRNRTGEFFDDITGLQPNTEYFFRAYGTNAQGDDWAPSSETFTTPAALPNVQNISASDVLGTSATVGGNVTATGGDVPTLVIHYGDNDAGTGSWDSQLDLGLQSGSESGSIAGLMPGTTYYFRAAATNSAGTAWAPASASFATTAVAQPGISNAAATSINGTFATLNGEVTDAGGDPPAVTIYYGTTDGGSVTGNWQFSISAGKQSGTFSRLATNLQPTSTYFFRAFAQNAAGGAWAASSLSFTTPEFVPPAIVINEIHYDEDDKTLRAEFIELYNPSDDPVDLSNYYFSDGIDFVFPSGTSLAAGGYLVVAEDPATMQSHFGYGGALGPFANGTTLKNSGEKIELSDPAGTVVDEVSYQLGFPWPTVGDDLGSPLASPSIELVHALLDNDLGGSWRASGFPVASAGGGGGEPVTLLAPAQSWIYRNGASYPSQDGSGNDWWDNGYDDSIDGQWLAGTTPIGFGDGDDNTVISGMQNNYLSFFARKEFTIAAGEVPNAIDISCYYDDGAVVYLNGVEVARFSVDAGAVPFPMIAGFANSHEAAWSTETVGGAASFLVEGTNVVAVQAINTSTGSSDISMDVQLVTNPGGSGSISNQPTPGAPNTSFATKAPPQIRQVDHSPQSPASAEAVTVTAKITDPDGVGTVSLEYQIVEPGDYFCRYLKFNTNGTANADPRFEDPANWTSVPMRDDGTAGDTLAADSIYTAVLPASLQTNRRLIRYRILAADASATAIRVPYEDDPQPNFAYFVYDGTPDWTGRIRSSDANPVTYPGALMSSIPTYFLLSTNSWVDDSQFGGYGGSEYLWPGTMVYDGKVYDHIRYRPRGGVHRYQYGKNFWKFDFARGRRFEARDRYGKRYNTEWDKLNFSSIVQQVNFNHRGEQGLFEGVGFKLFELCGVEACETHYVQFYVIDNASPTGANQYEGDYYGLFLAIEQMDSQYLDEHGMPDGNLYKIEGHNGTSNNQELTQVSDRSDVSTFISAYRNGNPTAQWWEDNLDIDKYLSYRTIVEGIHHYDIANGKNYFYYHNPETDKFEVHPWDLDLTWANNMFGSGNHDFKSKVAQNPAFNTRYQNRVREIMDLLYNTDEGYRLIDEMVRDVWTPGQPSLVGADRRLWDNNPRLNHPDRYYDVASDKEFSGMIQVLKNYIVSRGSWMTSNLLSHEGSIPDTPTITYTGTAGHPSNDLQFTSSAYSSGTGFGAMEWRLSEVYNPSTANYVPGEAYIYEIEGATESGELATFSSSYLFPTLAARPGHTYRARVRHQDSQGRWSHWSTPVEFLASAPDVSPYIDSLRITELHYHPSAASPGEAANGWEDSDFEFIEIKNIGAVAAELTDVRFTKGIDFDFPAITLIQPGAYALVVKNQAAFESRYGAGLPVVGEWASDNRLSNAGENVKLSLGAGTAIIEFTYDDASPWPTEPDGAGFSLTLHCPDQTLPAAHADPLAWRASRLLGGSPGTDDHIDFATWASSNGLGGGVKLTDDPENDGLNHLLEYALASNPTAESSGDLPTASHQPIDVGGSTDTYLMLTFRRQTASKDLTYSVDVSGDLGTWQSGVAALVSSTNHGDGTVTEVWRADQPVSTAPRQFMRLKVEG